MNPNLQLLAMSPRGRSVLKLLQTLMNRAGLGLDNRNRTALEGLVSYYWDNPGTCQTLINEIVGEEDNLKIFVAIDMTGDHLKLHIPKVIGPVEVLELEVDDPDYPGYRGRGIPHPAEESESLERDIAYETIQVR